MSNLPEKVKELAEIASSVPENLQVVCFELLLCDHLNSVSENSEQVKLQIAKSGSSTDPSINNAQKAVDKYANVQDDIALVDLHAKTRRFLEKYEVSISEVNNLFYKEEESIEPLYDDLKTTRMAEAQIRIALLQALRHALVTGDFDAEVDNIRKECNDRKVLDGSNFSAIFKKNIELFDIETYDKDTKSLRLNESGKEKLSKVIKELQ